MQKYHRLDVRKNYSQEDSGEALEQASQGGGGVTVPGVVQEKYRYGT